MTSSPRYSPAPLEFSTDKLRDIATDEEGNVQGRRARLVVTLVERPFVADPDVRTGRDPPTHTRVQSPK